MSCMIYLSADKPFSMVLSFLCYLPPQYNSSIRGNKLQFCVFLLKRKSIQANAYILYSHLENV